MDRLVLVVVMVDWPGDGHRRNSTETLITGEGRKEGKERTGECELDFQFAVLIYQVNCSETKTGM